MIDEKEFGRMQKELESFDEARERQITTSREVIKLSKLAIYAVHRNDLVDAKKHLLAMEKKLPALSRQSLDEGIGNVAFQEYVEAVCYFAFVSGKPLPSAKTLKVPTDQYLMGLCDLSGELVRRAIQDVITDNAQGAIKVRNFVEQLYGLFLRLNLRNGELRKKSDSIQWNLKKLDEIVFNVKVKK